MKLEFVVLNFNTFDSSGDRIAADGCEVPEHVAVTKNFQKGFQNRLGAAKLTKREKDVLAEFEWPGGDKLPPIALYPAIGGVIQEVIEGGQVGVANPQAARTIKKCKITEVSISSTPNQDHAILSIQEQNPSAPINWGNLKPHQQQLYKKPFTAEKRLEHVALSEAQVKPPMPSSSGDEN